MPHHILPRHAPTGKNLNAKPSLSGSRMKEGLQNTLHSTNSNRLEVKHPMYSKLETVHFFCTPSSRIQTATETGSPFHRRTQRASRGSWAEGILKQNSGSQAMLSGYQ